MAAFLQKALGFQKASKVKDLTHRNRHYHACFEHMSFKDIGKRLFHHFTVRGFSKAHVLVMLQKVRHGRLHVGCNLTPRK